MTKRDKRVELAKRIAEKTTKDFGHRTGFTASDLSSYKLDVTSTGVLALDYVLGTGGWAYGFMTEVYGSPGIGKSTLIGLGGIREAQQAGKLCGLIAMEPSFDTDWAIKNGVDPELLIVAYPDNGVDAFAILHEWVNEGVPEFIVFDSIGGVGAEAKEPGEIKAFGASGLISSNLTNLAQPVYKNDIALILLNQVRADTGAQIPGLVKPPGGYVKEHVCAQRVHIRPGKDRYYAKLGSGANASKVLCGRKLIAQIVKNKLAEKSAPGYKAQFDFYHMKVEDYPFGVDIGTDIINTAILAGVFKKDGSRYFHSTFPGDEHKIIGLPKLTNFVLSNSDVQEAIRRDVIQAMLRQAGEDIAKPELDAVKEE